MPDPRPLTGLFGKVPAHGDFVRRGLPTSFVAPWDAWLQAGMADARSRLGDRWPQVWDEAPAWRFALPAGACGPDPVAGVMLPSEDQVGRRFPITLAALLPAGGAVPDGAWFDAVEAAAQAGRAGRLDADGLAGCVPMPGAPLPALPTEEPWTGHAGVVPADPWQSGANQACVADAPPGGAVISVDPSDFASPPAPGAEDDVLSLLAGGTQQAGPGAAIDRSGPPGEDAGDDVLAMLAGDATEQAAPALGEGDDPARPARPEVGDDVLALFGGSASDPAAGLPDDADSLPDQPSAAGDDVLAMLAGAGDAAPAATEGAAALWEDPGSTGNPAEDGVLSMLAGDQPGPGLPADGALPLPTDALPMDAAPFLPPDILPAPALLAHLHASPAAGMRAIEAPPAPDGGGWWTRGGGSVEPMVWPLPALPSPPEFAFLLEAAS